jgi:hypothetical protein
MEKTPSREDLITMVLERFLRAYAREVYMSDIRSGTNIQKTKGAADAKRAQALQRSRGR